MNTIPAIVSSNCIEEVQGRFIQQDGTWFEKAGDSGYTHHRICPCCGMEIMKVRGAWESCGSEDV